MKKIIALVILAVLAVAGYFWGYPAYQESQATDERTRILAWEKRYAVEDAAYMKVRVLDTTIEKLEKKTGMKLEQLQPLQNSYKPDALRQRLESRKGDLFGESVEKIAFDVDYALKEVLEADVILGDATGMQPAAIRFKLGQQSSKEVRLTISAEVEKRFEALVAPVKEELERINALTWNDIPEYRLNELRQMNRLEYN